MSTPYEPPLEYVNVEEGLGRIRGNQKIYKMLLTTFLDNDSFQQLEADIAAQKIDEAAKTAHAVKGIAANLSLPKLYEHILLLEGQLKTGYFMPDSFADAQQSYKTTLEHVQKLVESL